MTIPMFAIYTGGNPAWLASARNMPHRQIQRGDTIDIGAITISGDTPAEQRSSFKLQLNTLPSWRNADTIFFKQERFAKWHEELKAENAEAQAITL
jgi:hypothetical protein